MASYLNFNMYLILSRVIRFIVSKGISQQGLHFLLYKMLDKKAQKA